MENNRIFAVRTCFENMSIVQNKDISRMSLTFQGMAEILSGMPF
jgi:hypothetical protein